MSNLEVAKKALERIARIENDECACCGEKYQEDQSWTDEIYCGNCSEECENNNNK